MIETKIKGLKVKITEEEVIIEDAYPITNVTKITEILSLIQEKDDVSFVFIKRDIDSLVREWRACSRLYRLGFKRNRYKDCILKNKNSKNLERFYFIMSFYTKVKKKKKRGK